MKKNNFQLNFVCVGPQRTASSWLDKALREHPLICLPGEVKETYYFDKRYSRGLAWYAKFFNECEDEKYTVEVCSTYFESQNALERIKEHNPEIKVIILVRNPIERSFSSFRHEYTKARVGLDFFQAVKKQPRIIDSGRYARIAPDWEDAFGKSNVFYLMQEDIHIDPQGQIEAVCNFLGMEKFELPEELRGRYGQGGLPRFRWLAAVASSTASALRAAGLHKVAEAGKQLGFKQVYKGGNPATLSMTRRIFDYLLAEHEPDIAWLETRLQRHFPHWRDPDQYGIYE